jgi:hypothetical protein
MADIARKNNDFTSYYDKALAIEPSATDAQDAKRLGLDALNKTRQNRMK